MEEVGRKMVGRFQSIRGLCEAGAEDIRALSGFERFEILRAQALMELGRRAEKAGPGDPKEIFCAEDAADMLSYLRHEKKEHFCVILLNSKGKAIRTTTIHVGTLNMSVVGPREVFREAIREGASSIVAVHNHPSGDPEPSPEDIEVTLKLKEIGVMLDIPVVDHVIIGDRRTVSLKARGVL